MRILFGDEEKKALEYITKAAEVARDATCNRSKCGSLIVQLDEIIGIGYNSPPEDNETQRRCSVKKDIYDIKVTDKTCCVHAEQRAIMDALRNNPHKLSGSKLYFIRLDDEGNPSRADEPYCTICSKMALDVGISEFILWQNKGLVTYDTKEYNQISFNFGKEK